MCIFFPLILKDKKLNCIVTSTVSFYLMFLLELFSCQSLYQYLLTLDIFTTPGQHTTKIIVTISICFLKIYLN